MYVSLLGSVLWQNACWMSPVLGMHLFWTAREMRNRNSSCDNTGAKQSSDDHLVGSRLPRATILYFARTGSLCPLVLIVEIAMVGMIPPLPIFLRT